MRFPPGAAPGGTEELGEVVPGASKEQHAEGSQSHKSVWLDLLWI